MGATSAIAYLLANADRFPIDLARRVDTLAQAVDMTHQQCHTSYNAIGEVEDDINAFVEEIAQEGRGEHITAMSNFWYGPGAHIDTPGGVASDGQDAQTILLALAEPTQRLADGISSLLPAINHGIQALNDPRADMQVGIAPPGVVVMNMDLVNLSNALQELSDLLSRANSEISGALIIHLLGPLECRSGVTPGQNQSWPASLQEKPPASRSAPGVQINLDLLRSLAQHSPNGVEVVDNETSRLIRNLNILTDALAALTGVPIISQAAGKLLETLNEVTSRLVFSLVCYSTGLSMIEDGLAKAVSALTEMDANLSALLADLNSLARDFKNRC